MEKLNGYCWKCSNIQEFNHDLKDVWGNSCKNCGTFIPLNQFSQCIDIKDINIEEKSEKTLIKELLIKSILVIEKSGQSLINNENLLLSQLELFFRTAALIMIIISLTINAGVLTEILEVIKTIQTIENKL